MHNPKRLALAVGTFLLCFALECWWFISSIPFERISSEAIHAFLNISMGMGFLPVVLLPLLMLAVAALIALVPAYLVYASGPPAPGSPQARMQERLKQLKKMTPQRMQKK